VLREYELSGIEGEVVVRDFNIRGGIIKSGRLGLS
jgi:hypothetical protein